MQQQIFSTQGKKLTKKATLDDKVFGAKINKHLMNLSVYVYLQNQRTAAAHTKTRSEVRGGGAKPWRQKGTGRARHGSIRSPIWKGGGVTFGPRNDRNYKKKLTKKMKKAAIRSAFSQFAKDKKVLVLETGDIKDERMTKQVVDLYAALPVEGKTLFIQNNNNKNLHLGARNLKEVKVINVNQVSVYTLLNNKNIVILEDALEEIHKLWGSEQKSGVSSVERQPEVKKEKSVKKETKKDGIEGLDLPARTMTALKKAKITDTKQLKAAIEKGDKIPGVGPKSIEDIKKLLK